MGLFFLALIVVPIVEIVVLLEVGQIIGVFPTVVGILATAFIGTALARQQGLAAWQNFSAAMRGQAAVDQAVVAGLAVFVGGALLLTPGFVTDIVGFLLLIPVSREALWTWLKPRMSHRFQVHAGAGSGTSAAWGRPTSDQGSYQASYYQDEQGRVVEVFDARLEDGVADGLRD